MATCRAQTSLQPPLALPYASSHCLLGFLLFLKYTIEMKATLKLRPPHPSAERPLQGVRGSLLSVHCSHADITSSNVPYFSSLRCLRKCAKMRTFESDRIKGCFNFGTSGNHQKADLKANAYIQNDGNTVQSTQSH